MTVTTTPGPARHPGYSRTLPREPESAGAARKLVRTALAAWEQDDLVEDALLITTELVSNALDHACHGPMRIIVSLPTDQLVRIGVVDRSKAVPMMRTDDAGGDDLRGRGLLLVDALSDRWGTDLYRWGKQVWSELVCSGPPPP
ncbi:ATP-binding protein [Streptomyces sp. NPDC002793]|uniref:ATP-binding protein n=1 Tax=Streptomyces sp. NPDC002793 TaxID=3154432 RepID=UPI00332004F5